MIKTGLTSFIYSFVLSLFVFFGIDKAFFSTQKKAETSLPRGNISLFLKKNTVHDERGRLSENKINLFKSSFSTDEALLPSASRDDIVEADINDILVSSLADNDVAHKEKANLHNLKENTSKENDTSTFTSSNEIAPPLLENEGKELNIVSEKEHRSQMVLASVKALSDTEEENHQISFNDEDDTDMIKVDVKTSFSQPIVLGKASTGSASDEDVSMRAQPFQVAENINTPKQLIQKVRTNELLIPLQKNKALPQFASKKIHINTDVADAQVAMLNFDKPIDSIIDKEKEEKKSQQAQETKWQTMSSISGEEIKKREVKDIYNTSQVDTLTSDKLPDSEKASTSFSESSETSSSPWVAVKGTKFPKNSEILNKPYYLDADEEKISGILNKKNSSTPNEVKVAGEVLDNILIPIPQDILDNKDLMPNLVSDPDNKKLENELLAKETGTVYTDKDDDVPFIGEEENKNSESNNEKGEKKNIFQSIASFFTPSSDTSEEGVSLGLQNNERLLATQKHAKRFSNQEKISSNGKILPSEMRLSFQNGKAEISGKTLDWVKAFGQKALTNSDQILEIRIDGTSSIDIQQKRLNLLYNILTNLGLEYSKVNTVFTHRGANTFILRVVKAGEDSDKKRYDPASIYYRKW